VAPGARVGITLVFAGLVTSEPVSVLGGILVIAGAVGWFRNVLPTKSTNLFQSRQGSRLLRLRDVMSPGWKSADQPKRAWLPLETYPVSAGIKGGLAGSVVMAGLAMLYGLISGNGIWYPVNLLVAGFFPGAVNATTAQIAEFRMSALLLAVPIHLITSLLVGLLYGVMLQCFLDGPSFWVG